MDREFMDYVKEHVKDFLPTEYADADIGIETVTKNNDRELSGIIIRRPGQEIVPTIYLEYFEEEYLAGKPLRDVTEHVAKSYLKSWQTVDFDRDILFDYGKAKECLFITLCDPENNEKYLEGKPYDMVGAYAAVYRLEVARMGDGTGSISVTDEMMERWGVTHERLHKDAVTTEKRRDPARLFGMDDMMRNVFSGEEGHNLLNDTELPVSSAAEIAGINMFVLTNESKMNGAAVIARDGLLDRVGELFGSDYYILPSSVHELILVPDNGMIGFEDLSRMVRDVNDAELKTEDMLSYKVQRYDRESRCLEQAPGEERQQGVLARLNENKEKAAGTEMRPDAQQKKAEPCI